MKESMRLRVEGYEGEFIVNPMPLDKGLKLCRTVDLMILRALKALDTLKEPIIKLILDGDMGDVTDEEIIGVVKNANIERVMEVFIEVIQTLDSDELLRFVQAMLSNVQYLSKDAGALDFSEMSTINRIFGGNISSIYRVMFAVMKYNNFTPFAIGGIGSLLKQTDSSTVPDQKVKPSANF